MEELEGILEGIENVDMAEVQKAFMNDPSLRESAMEMLKNPNLTSELKNYFKGGSKWRNKHRKKRGSGGKHSKEMTSMYTPPPFYKHVGKNLHTFPSASSSKPKPKDKEVGEVRGEKKRRGAFDDSMENSPLGFLSRREAPEEKIYRLREEAKAMKKLILEKEKKDIEKGTNVMYGGKWSLKYKRSINCRKPKGFSQKQYCKRKNRKSKKKRKKSRKKRKRKKRKTRRKRR